MEIPYQRTCDCTPNKLNCLTPKEWTKCQIGVWQFNYEKRDIRDKNLHPATFPIALAAKCIGLFSHEGELVVDPFNGSGTTLVAARDLNRNAVGFDLAPEYIAVTRDRLAQEGLFTETQQVPIEDDARFIAKYLQPETITMVMTSPPYANMLDRQRLSKSRRTSQRKNEQYLKNEQYSRDTRDLGMLDAQPFADAMEEVFRGLWPLLRPKAHVLININDIVDKNACVPLHSMVTQALEKTGLVLRNIIIWDRGNLVNNVGIFGWPSNYLVMNTTFEYIMDFQKPV